MAPAAPSPARAAWQRFAATVVRSYHRYASWLVSISWKRFILLSILLLIVAAILEEVPPFRWRVTEHVSEPRLPGVPPLPEPPAPPRKPVVKIEKPKGGGEPKGVDISIGEDGIRITPRVAAQAASAAASAASAAEAAASAVDRLRVPEVRVDIPPGASREEIRQAVEDAKEALREAVEDAKEVAREAAEEGRRAAEEAQRELAQAQRELERAQRGNQRTRTRTIQLADFLTDLAFLWILGSAIIKVTYKGKLQAEVKAAEATEAAEAESLKRQVVEARMAAMQAQVEPHFLFNTLASIDHLIETDPPRASRMQKNLIALLRASMPTMRETGDGGLSDLGRELAVIRPYLEILKVRMEERLRTDICVPKGLLSAQFPPMMIQTLVENAIKHGLEPKPEGGELRVCAEVVDGKLAVSVVDTGLGFGKAATAGTGVGLVNVRERLQLLYGGRATLAVTENEPSGTTVTITVPYSTRAAEDKPAAA